MAPPIPPAPFADGAYGLVVHLHNAMLRRLSCHALVHFNGLQQAARCCRRLGYIDNGTCQKLCNLDITFNLMRHVTRSRLVRKAMEVRAHRHRHTVLIGLFCQFMSICIGVASMNGFNRINAESVKGS